MFKIRYNLGTSISIQRFYMARNTGYGVVGSTQPGSFTCLLQQLNWPATRTNSWISSLEEMSRPFGIVDVSDINLGVRCPPNFVRIVWQLYELYESRPPRRPHHQLMRLAAGHSTSPHLIIISTYPSDDLTQDPRAEPATTRFRLGP